MYWYKDTGVVHKILPKKNVFSNDKIHKFVQNVYVLNKVYKVTPIPLLTVVRKNGP